MLPYNFKVWAHPAEMMNKEWIGERVAVLDYNRAIKNVVLGTDDFGWGPNNTFVFPAVGGTGEIYKRLAARLPACGGGRRGAAGRQRRRGRRRTARRPPGAGRASAG